ncbi:MAG: helix-turn-helix transcriptional regulator [Polyangiaceae bacterium]
MPIDRPELPHRIDPDTLPCPAFVLAERHDAGAGAPHAHARAQLIHASEGVVVVRAADGEWVVPRERAVWVLPGVEHSVSSRSGYLLRTLYVEPMSLELPPRCAVVAVDRLAEELLVEASRFGARYEADTAESRLVRVLLDRLPTLDELPFHLPRPVDPRILPIADALRQNPADDRTLAAWAKSAGTTERTAARLFQAETGLPFGAYRTQARMLASLELLGEGKSVTDAAIDVGYRDVSGFIAAFAAAFGITPGKYIAPQRR